MISNIIAFFAGALFASFAPESFRAWVRGVAGKARDVFFGARPARNSNPTNIGGAAEKNSSLQAVSAEFKPDISPDIPRPVPPGIFGEIPVGNVSPTRPNKPIRLSQFLGALWNWKWAIVAVLFFALGLGVLRGWIPSPFGKSRDELRAELKEERLNHRVLEHEMGLERLAREQLERSFRDRERARTVLQDAQEEFTDAVEQEDFDRLYSAYVRAHNRLWSLPEADDRANPDRAADAPVPGAGGGPV